MSNLDKDVFNAKWWLVIYDDEDSSEWLKNVNGKTEYLLSSYAWLNGTSFLDTRDVRNSGCLKDNYNLDRSRCMRSISKVSKKIIFMSERVCESVQPWYEENIKLLMQSISSQWM